MRVLDALEQALAQDRAKARIVALSPSGIVEISRRREGPSLRSALNRPCPYCSGRGVVKTPQTVAIETRRRIRELASSARGSRAQSVQGAPQGAPQGALWVQVTMHPESACALLEDEGALARALESECSVAMHLSVDFGLHLETARLSTGLAGESSSHDALSSRLVVGERVSLPASTPLYPADLPVFAVLHGQLVRLDGPGIAIDSSRSATVRSTMIEVTSVGRWFATAILSPGHSGSG